MASHSEQSLTDPGSAAHVAHEPGSNFKKIWIPFFVLLGITVIEFIIALAIPESVLAHRPWKVLIYVVLTIAKAYFIVSYFMHLGFERVGLIYSIVVPILFIIVLILALMFEGSRLAY